MNETLLNLSDAEVLEKIDSIKRRLKDQLVILGHHYQQDDIIRFADVTGDSLYLSHEAAKLSAPYVVFCGVHFMAETADMLTHRDTKVILPDLEAGCSMADMATRFEVEKAYRRIEKVFPTSEMVPITYINCTAELKAFVGENGGTICTSSNAKKIIQSALQEKSRLFFFPDQHLGRNTAAQLGIPLNEMVVYNPKKKDGGLTDDQLKNAKIILWYGYCSVHQGFKPEHIDNIRKSHPGIKVIVHPECDFEVVRRADQNGSTAYIIDQIKAAPQGATFAVGTEINLVNRLAKEMPDKTILSLSPYQCLCTTMYRVRPRWLLASLISIQRGDPINVISVAESIRKPSLLALDRMFRV